MKKVMQMVEVEGEGLLALMGQRVCLWCARYIYYGTLTGVNEDCVLLENVHIVYETGPLGGSKFKDAQQIGPVWYVQKGAIESFGPVTLVV